MKTWWDFAGLFFLALLIPLVGFLPTFSFNGKMYGGGIIRQYLVNQIIPIMQPEKARILADYFLSANYWQEAIVYLPIAINFIAILFLTIYCFGSISIQISNFIHRDKYQRQRDSIKR